MPPDYRIDAEIFRLYPGYRRGLVLAQRLRNGPSPRSADRATARRRRRRCAAKCRAIRPSMRASPRGAKPTVASARGPRNFAPRSRRSRAGCCAATRCRASMHWSTSAIWSRSATCSRSACIRSRRAAVRCACGCRQPGDSFLPPDGGAAESPERAEVVFAQGSAVLTRRWTWRQAALTLTLPETCAVFFNIDALQGVADDAVAAATGDIVQSGARALRRRDAHHAARCRASIVGSATRLSSAHHLQAANVCLRGCLIPLFGVARGRRGHFGVERERCGRGRRGLGRDDPAVDEREMPRKGKRQLRRQQAVAHALEHRLPAHRLRRASRRWRRHIVEPGCTPPKRTWAWHRRCRHRQSRGCPAAALIRNVAASTGHQP